MTSKLAIIIPVFNDWVSFRSLLKDLSVAMSDHDCEITIVAVDDCSLETPPLNLEFAFPIVSVKILRLTANMGHQRAIAIGLSTVSTREDIDYVAVMDSDGEDRPAELARLLSSAIANPKVAVLAQRAKRSEGPRFKLMYRLYTLVFRLLTGQQIDFGNFSVLPIVYVEQLTARPEIWNNFPATLIRARIPFEKLPTSRGLRYAGESRMNTFSLVAHGLGAMSVFSELIFIRILFASTLLLSAIAVGVITVLGVRFFSDLAIPGWATNALGFLVVMGFQTIMMAAMMAFLQLNNRSFIQTAPCNVAEGYIRESLTFDNTQEEVIS